MNEKKKIGSYTVIYEMHFGHKVIAVGEDKNAKVNERYLCCFVENNVIFERYLDALVSDDYAEIIKIFGNRIKETAESIIAEHERAEKAVGDNSEITADKCDKITDADCIENKVIVIKGSELRPECRFATDQLMLCTGGFGSQSSSRGRTCYCISLYNGEKASCYRSDVLGTIEPDNLPEWAKNGLSIAKQIQNEEKGFPQNVGEAR